MGVDTIAVAIPLDRWHVSVLDSKVPTERLCKLDMAAGTLDFCRVRGEALDYAASSHALVRWCLNPDWAGYAPGQGPGTLGGYRNAVLEVETSLPKLMAGHNVFELDDADGALEYLRYQVGQVLNVDLCPTDDWVIRRWDECLAERVGRGAIPALLDVLSKRRLGRREATRHAHSTTWVGQESTMKAYAKGPEFARHDASRLKNAAMEQPLLPFERPTAAGRRARQENPAAAAVEALVRYAADVLRFEVTHRPRSIARLFEVSQLRVQTWRYLRYVGIDPFREHMAAQLARVFGEGVAPASTVAIETLILERFGARQAQTMLGFYSDLMLYGEARVRERSDDSTFNRKMKLLRDAEIPAAPPVTDLAERYVPLADPAVRVRKHDADEECAKRLDFGHSLGYRVNVYRPEDFQDGAKYPRPPQDAYPLLRKRKLRRLGLSQAEAARALAEPRAADLITAAMPAFIDQRRQHRRDVHTNVYR